MRRRSLFPPGSWSGRPEEMIKPASAMVSHSIAAGPIADSPRLVGRGSDRARRGLAIGRRSLVTCSIIAGAAVSAGPISLAA